MLPPPLGLCICKVPCNTTALNLANDSRLSIYAYLSSTGRCTCEDRTPAQNNEAISKRQYIKHKRTLLQEPAHLFATGATLDHLPSLLQTHHCPERSPALLQHLERWALARCSAELATAWQPLLMLAPPQIAAGLVEAFQAPGAASLRCGHPQKGLHVMEQYLRNYNCYQCTFKPPNDGVMAMTGQETTSLSRAIRPDLVRGRMSSRQLAEPNLNPMKLPAGSHNYENAEICSP